MQQSCPFCNLPSSRIVFSNSLVVALWDGFPVSPGHLLIVPKRHVATWFEANEEERREIWQAIEKGKEAICQLYQPDGFNIGINVGEAAGQTVPHLHLHIIPRFQGDVPDPRGGVRYVIPHKANYLKSTPDSSDNTLVKPEPSPANETVRVQHQHADDLGKVTKVVPKSPVKRSADIGDSALVRGERDPLLPHLQNELETAANHAAFRDVGIVTTKGAKGHEKQNWHVARSPKSNVRGRLVPLEKCDRR